MPIKAEIQDGTGTGLVAKVTTNHALRVSIQQSSASDMTEEEASRLKLYRGYMKDSVDSRDLNVDGSTVPHDYTVVPQEGIAFWIRSVRFIFHSERMSLVAAKELQRFGAAGGTDGLTNGLEMWFEQGGQVVQLFNPAVLNVADMMQTADDFVNFTNGISNVVDYLHMEFDFDVPIVLMPTSVDRIVVRVNDDLTDLDMFEISVRGWKEIL